MTYVDGFVAAVPTANREIYKKHAAELSNQLFRYRSRLVRWHQSGGKRPAGK
jgi:uncharacterized protein YbaA (DUF1428 family)